MSRGEHAPEPPSEAHGFTMLSMSLRDMQISKSEKNISAPPPPLPNSGDAPVTTAMLVNTVLEYTGQGEK